jgi:hypothetical protein
VTYQLNLNEARSRRTTKDLTQTERQEIISYFEEHPTDEKALPYVMEKYNLSKTSVTMILVTHRIEGE